MPKNDEKKIGYYIRRAREDQDITREELANKLGMSVSYIYRIESGYGGYSLTTLKKFSKALNKPISYFYQWEELEEKSKVKDTEGSYLTEKVDYLTELVKQLAEIVLPDPKQLIENVPQKSDQEKLELTVELVKKLTPDQAKIIMQAIIEEHLKS